MNETQQTDYQDEPLETDEQETDPNDGYGFMGVAIDNLIAAWAEPLVIFFGFLKGWLGHGDFWGTRSIRLEFPLTAEWPFGYVAGILESHGIDIYDAGALFDKQFVEIDSRDEQRAEYILSAYGLV